VKRKVTRRIHIHTKACKKPTWVVSYYYFGAPNRTIESEMTSASRKFKGACGGSGFFFPLNQRDIAFVFPSREGAMAFQKYVSKNIVRTKHKMWKEVPCVGIHSQK